MRRSGVECSAPDLCGRASRSDCNLGCPTLTERSLPLRGGASVQLSDYSRYLPSKTGVRATFWWTFSGALIGGIWMMLVGTAAAALNAQIETLDAVHQAGDMIFSGFGTIGCY